MASGSEKKHFSDRAFYSKLIHIMIPVALQNLMLSAVAAADAVMLGSTSQNSMSAVSLATQVQFIQNMIVMAVTSAAGVLGAQYWGRKDKKSLEEIFGFAVKLAAIISLFFFAACEFIPGKLMLIFTNEPELIETGISYLKIAGWSYLITGICECFLTMMRVSEHVPRSVRISSGAVVINIALNGVFIFGLLGLPAMGADGAALATLISRVIEIIWAAVSSLQKGFIRLRIKYVLRIGKDLRHDFIKCVMPLFGGYMLWSIGFTTNTAIMGHLGTDAAAANSVAAVVRDLMCCLCNGMASAGVILIGNELGAGNLERGKLYGNRLIRVSFICGLISMAIVLAVTPFVVNFMSLTAEAERLLKGMMVIMSVYMIGRCVNTVTINGVFDAGGDTMFDMYSLAVTMWGIAIPAALLGAFAFDWPVLFVYACTCLDEVGKIPWTMMHNRKYKWVKDLTHERQ